MPYNLFDCEYTGKCLIICLIMNIHIICLIVNIQENAFFGNLIMFDCEYQGTMPCYARKKNSNGTKVYET